MIRIRRFTNSDFLLKIFWILVIILPISNGIIPVVYDNISILIFVFLFLLVIFLLNHKISINSIIKPYKYYILFFMYILIICCIYYTDITTLKKMVGYSSYLLITFVFSYSLRDDKININRIIMFIFTLFILYLILANIINPNFVATLKNISGNRYAGSGGINWHGYISAIAFMLTCHVYQQNLLRLKFFIILSAYTIFNLIITNSRASIIAVIIYVCFIFLLKGISKNPKKVIKLLISFSIIALGLILLLYTIINNSELSTLFRINAGSITKRIEPIFKSIELIKENNYMPYGIGKTVVETLTYGNDFPLDNSYLVIAIESGLLGIILILSFIISNLIFGIKTLLVYNRVAATNEKNTKTIISLLSIEMAILVHGFFESVLFSGFKVGTIILFFCFSAVYKLHSVAKHS